jgi:membrane-bound serine protease (ClpP class)
LVLIGLVLIVLGSLRRARKTPAQVSTHSMRGLSAEVLDWNDIEGHVFTQGERWQARGTEAFRPGETVEVASITDLTLTVCRRPTLSGGVGGVR